jgi:S1-C subfamily serine protease
MEFQSRSMCRRGTFILSFVLVLRLLAAPPAFAQTATNGIENSVVKVFSTVRYPDPYRPWTKQSPTDITGSGVVISGKRILSNAHVVLYASQVQVQANQAGDKISATVEAIAPGIDLAVLKLDDESFFDAHQPLPFSTNLPGIKDSVLAYGYPEGGNGLSITKGIVSRIEFVPYNLPVYGLRIQIDAAINPGNSGGPAVVGDRMIGLAFSHYREAQNIGYIIPTEEIQLFLADVADGHYDGKPALRGDFQTLENPALRAFLQPGKSAEGMVVNKPDSDAPDYPLKQWDIITYMGDTPVDDQGMIKIGDNLRIHFTYLVQKIAKDGKVPLTIVRAGKELKVEVPVSAKNPLLIPNLDGSYPSFFIYGPMVFSTATQLFASGLINNTETSRYRTFLNVVGSPLVSRNYDKAAFDGEGLVVVSSPFLPHKLTKGYGDPFAEVVKTVNGIHIKNLGHLVEVLRDTTDKYVIVEFDGRIGETLVFPREEMAVATDEILTDNGIRAQGSADTLAVWNAKKAGK